MREPQAVNFGALPLLPPGYRVVWSETCEMYIPQGPEDWEGRMTWDRFRARREALHHAGRIR